MVGRWYLTYPKATVTDNKEASWGGGSLRAERPSSQHIRSSYTFLICCNSRPIYSYFKHNSISYWSYVFEVANYQEKRAK